MVGLVDALGEEHQKAGHQGEYGEQAEENGLDQHGAHIIAQPEAHERHGQQAGNGGQAGTGNLRDGLAQCLNAGLTGRQMFPLLGEAVTQNDGVVDGQRQLQNHGHGVGDKGDFTHQEVGAHIQYGGCQEGQHQHRDFHISMGGEQQHRNDDEGGHHHDDGDFLL